MILGNSIEKLRRQLADDGCRLPPDVAALTTDERAGSLLKCWSEHDNRYEISGLVDLLRLFDPAAAVRVCKQVGPRSRSQANVGEGIVLAAAPRRIVWRVDVAWSKSYPVDVAERLRQTAHAVLKWWQPIDADRVVLRMSRQDEATPNGSAPATELRAETAPRPASPAATERLFLAAFETCESVVDANVFDDRPESPSFLPARALKFASSALDVPYSHSAPIESTWRIVPPNAAGDDESFGVRIQALADVEALWIASRNTMTLNRLKAYGDGGPPAVETHEYWPTLLRITQPDGWKRGESISLPIPYRERRELFLNPFVIEVDRAATDSVYSPPELSATFNLIASATRSDERIPAVVTIEGRNFPHGSGASRGSFVARLRRRQPQIEDVAFSNVFRIHTRNGWPEIACCTDLRLSSGRSSCPALTLAAVRALARRLGFDSRDPWSVGNVSIRSEV